MAMLRIFLILGWIAIAGVTVAAMTSLGVSGFIETVLEDLRHPWRLQVYVDFELHLLLVAGWIAWRERPLGIGLVCAAATLVLGALFTLPYLLFATVRAEGSARRLLLGARA
ncbi:MAG TPA: hypothetical protein VD887_05390 [Allosphingosinicella sp.]|nr:hypothetical protein [Allosphingosinicella sp.]